MTLCASCTRSLSEVTASQGVLHRASESTGPFNSIARGRVDLGGLGLDTPLRFAGDEQGDVESLALRHLLSHDASLAVVALSAVNDRGGRTLACLDD